MRLSKKFLSVIALCFLFSATAFADRKPYSKAPITVSVSGTQVPLASSREMYVQAVVCAMTNNTNVVYVGGSNVDYATKIGTPLWGGSTRADCRVYDAQQSSGNLADIWVDAQTGGEGVTVEWYKNV